MATETPRRAPAPCWFDDEGHCHSTPWPGIHERVTTLTFAIDKDGSFRPRYIAQYDDWPHRLKSAAEEELLAARTEDDAFRQKARRASVEVRAYDIRNEVVFRAVVPIALYSNPLEPWPGVATPAPVDLRIPPPWSFIVVIPREAVQRVELRGWRPGSNASYDIDVLARDPILRMLP